VFELVRQACADPHKTEDPDEQRLNPITLGDPI
jgi:hypothetical protein